MATQSCPICSTVVPPNPRYPRYLCRRCTRKATSADGRLLNFSNVSWSGGFAARYADTGEEKERRGEREKGRRGERDCGSTTVGLQETGLLPGKLIDE